MINGAAVSLYVEPDIVRTRGLTLVTFMSYEQPSFLYLPLHMENSLILVSALRESTYTVQMISSYVCNNSLSNQTGQLILFIN